MALSWTQDRLGPMCRYAEDCALVMQAIAKPDGRDMSVSDVPFNWDAALDVRRLRVGIIQESFDSLTNDDAKANAAGTLDTLRSIGVTSLTAMTIPEFETNLSSLGVESAAYFDHMRRTGRMVGSRGVGRASAWLTPAVEYLQSQRVRMMMMMKLEEATRGLDVYIVASTDHGFTWTSPTRIDSGPGTTFQVMPTATIDPQSSAIVVHYYDNRSGATNGDGNFVLDVFATVSLDGGATFGQDFRISDMSFDPDAGARCRRFCSHAPVRGASWLLGALDRVRAGLQGGPVQLPRHPL